MDASVGNTRRDVATLVDWSNLFVQRTVKTAASTLVRFAYSTARCTSCPFVTFPTCRLYFPFLSSISSNLQQTFSCCSSRWTNINLQAAASLHPDSGSLPGITSGQMDPEMLLLHHSPVGPGVWQARRNYASLGLDWLGIELHNF